MMDADCGIQQQTQQGLLGMHSSLRLYCCGQVLEGVKRNFVCAVNHSHTDNTKFHAL